MAHVVVVGGGIAGLAAAHELVGRDGVEVTVVEASGRLGGKVATEPFAGLALDAGPDAFLARRPEAVGLCRELGLEDDLVAPASTAASVWVRGRLRPLPAGLVLGVPTDLGALALSGILSPLGTLRAALEPLLGGPALDVDEAVASLIGRRFGAETAASLVDPLIGGINAGDTRRLSVDAVAPQVAAAARRSASLVRGARPAAGSAPGPAGPVFLTLPGGLGGLVDALAARLRDGGARLETGTAVTSVERWADGRYRAFGAGALEADGVVLAVPAFAAAPLLAPLVPPVAATLAAVEHASVVLVALCFAAGDVGPLRGSGFLVPRAEGRLMTACTWTSSKWAHLAPPGRVLLRVSAGRAGDERALAMDDDDLVARLRVELEASLGITAAPREVRVTRWPAGFPQYAPGHLEAMAAVTAALDAALPGVALAGAALGGVGIPACIGSGRAAAAAVLRRLRLLSA